MALRTRAARGYAVLDCVSMVGVACAREARLLECVRWAAMSCAALAFGLFVFAKAKMRLLPSSPQFVTTTWRYGQRLSRTVSQQPPTSPDTESSATDEIVAQGWLSSSSWILATALVPGVDGVRVSIGNKICYILPDDLIVAHAYESAVPLGSTGLGFGTDPAAIVQLAAGALGVPLDRARLDAKWERIRVRRRPGPALATQREEIEQFSQNAAAYLARNVLSDGRFRYEVDAISGAERGVYEFARHAGATYYLALSYKRSKRGEFGVALSQATRALLSAVEHCGPYACIVREGQLEFGGTALGLLALVQAIEADVPNVSPELPSVAKSLSEFLRSQQKSDGEFQHDFDMKRTAPVDRQYPFYSGEAVLALARYGRFARDAASLDAASRGLRYLVTRGWNFFGNRYFYGAEHWTCQAVAELWQHQPDCDALQFCLRWSEQGDLLQQQGSDAAFDVDGNYGVGPVFEPQLIAVGGRVEGVVGTFEAARQAGVNPFTLARLRSQIERALRLVARHQLGREHAHLLNSPYWLGGVPTSPVNLSVRIDGPQHAGAAAIRYLDATSR